ncbi:MAG: hypothetical protein KC415_07935 [Anaerolineales bacterium]|nr:hypothetical protein [Anaerolineales bacterium]MCB9004158.1 hypothetical protein [Ardenticatenaceae bacterium]
MSNALMPFIWVVVAFLVLLLMQRWIHTHLHGVSMLLTRRADWAVIIYALILLPGVFLHELSHWVMAKLLGVRTGSFSLIPRRQPDGSVVLGYVEYYKGRTLGPIRESLVGGAPLIVGTAVILLIGFKIFGVTNLTAAIQSGEVNQLSQALGQIFTTNDFLVWLYLLFAIANAMMPSPADRRAWPAFLWMMATAALLLYLLGISDDLLSGLAAPATTVFGYLGIAFSMSIAVDILFMITLAIVEWLIGRILGVSVIYGAEPPPGTEKVVL